MPDGVIWIVADTSNGGLAAAAVQHARWLQERGYAVKLIWGAVGGVTPDTTGLTVVSIDMPGGLRDLAGDLLCMRQILLLSHAERPAVIHCHGQRSFVLTSLVLRRRCFVTQHGFGSLGSRRLERLIRGQGQRIIPVIAQRALSVAPYPPSGWEFIPLASPSLTYLPTLTKSKRFTLLWVGRLADPKRPQDFLDVIEGVNRLGDIPVGGLMVGAGPLAEQLKQYATDLELPVRFVQATPTPWNDAQAGDIFCLFTNFEGVPFSLQEAMWLGLPCVVSDLPNLRWLGGDSVLYAGDSAEAMEQILSLLKDPSRAEALGRAAWLRARQLLGDDDGLGQIVGMYSGRVGLS
jgi:glycosyltransferase involved in cell wall biosynthesis